MTVTTPSTTPLAVQASFDDLGTPLSQATFVVVDLETTGGSHQSCGITEIGAVKVRGGEVLGEFQTLVNPGEAIPPFIAVLTGITDGMVARAPRIDAVLPSFLEFASGAVLVAHNAPFDVGFLRTAAERTGLGWPRFDVLDTARLARRTLTRDEAPNCKLATLARLFRASTDPTHRALDDARATVDVLHGLFERLGCHGVTTLEEVGTFSTRVHPAQRRKRYLADDVPSTAGVYLFRDGRGRVLYVGKSVDLRSRVRQYFTAAEQRRRMAEMVAAAEEVVSIPCPTPLEAEVRELRLIAEHKPPYNRRSKFPEKASFVKLTVEPFPRLSTVRQVMDDGATYLGPFGSRRAAEQATAALHEALPLRQCTGRLSPRALSSACVLAGLGRCGAPCEGSESIEAYALHVAAAQVAMSIDPSVVVTATQRRIAPLVDAERFEDAATHRDRLLAFLRSAARGQRLSGLTGCPLLVAARQTHVHGWQVVVVRHGRLSATAQVARGVDPWPTVDALVVGGEAAVPGPGPTPAATAEETECVLRWLDTDGVRLVLLDGTWASPVAGAAGALARMSSNRLLPVVPFPQ
ncbi:MAG: DEDD exonuclease domain-containing protein [Actinomycetes bacterium]